MRLSCITPCKKKLFFMLIVSCFCYIETIRLYVFDSPSALQNVLQDDVSLANRLRSIYSKKYKYWTFLTHTFNSSVKNNYTTIRYLQKRLQKRKCQNCNEPNGNRYDFDLGYNKRKNESYFRMNMFSKDSPAQVFNGAVHGLIMLQQVYDIDVEHFANGKIVPEQGGHPNMTAISDNRKSGEKLTYFDLILLSLHAILVAWYYNAIKYLDVAAKYLYIEDSIEHKIRIPDQLQGIIPYLMFIAKSGLSLQQTDETFDLESRLLPFSTSRFDHGRVPKG